jgi:conjugative transposon TraM protein
MRNQQKIDSINKEINASRENIQKQLASIGSSKSSAVHTTTRRGEIAQQEDDDDPTYKLIAKMKQGENSYETNNRENNNGAAASETSGYDEQMRVFKDQMKYIDSMQNTKGDVAATGGNQQNTEYNNKGIKKWREGKGRDSSENILPVSVLNQHNDRIFNTISNAANEDNNITAMIDEDVKATLGARVRIRLLKNIYVGDYLIKQGAYIYGMVTGFQKQRVNISIVRIMNENVSLPVKLNVYDNDGYLGLYVPGSDFREFSKEIGTTASQGMSTAITPDGSNVTTGILSQLFNTTTTTMANLIKKDRAFLKYNYMVFLKPVDN